MKERDQRTSERRWRWLEPRYRCSVTEVLSVLEPGLAIVGLGKRDVSFDLGLLVPMHIVRSECDDVEPFSDATATVLDDQHGYLRLGDEQAAVVAAGDRTGFGLAHSCIAFDK